MATEKQPGAPQFDGAIDIEPFLSLSAEQREGAEAAAIQEILLRVPESMREGLRAGLLNPFATGGSSPDPEIARLMGVVFSARAATVAETQQRARVEEAQVARGEDPVQVRIALVESFPWPEGFGVVIREPDDNGIPLLVFPEGTTDDDLLVRGLNAAIRSHDRTGLSVPKKTVQILRGRRGPGVRVAGAGRVSWSSLIPDISPVRAIPGLGSGRTVHVMAPRVRR